MTAGVIAASMAPERPPLKMHFTQVVNAAQFNLQPSALITVNEQFVSDTGQWTKLTPNTAATFAIVSGQGKFSNPNASARSDFFLEGADIGMPQCCVMITVISQANDGGTPTGFDDVQVGICKDVNNFIWARYDNVAGGVKVRTGVAGTVVNHNFVTCSVTFPFQLALTIVRNQATIWTNSNGAGWIAQTTYDFTSDIDFRTASMTGWKGAFAVETNNNSDWTVDNFTVGRFGGVGMRDQCIVTNEDGTPYLSGNLAYFTATCVDSNGVGYMGVFSYDTTSRAVAQTGIVLTNLSGSVRNDLSGQIIKYNSGADCRLFTSSWANGFGSTLSVLHGTATGTDLLSGSHVVTVSALTLPGHVGGGGEYDPFAVKIGSTWYMAYTITTNTSFAGNTFYSAAASSPDLSTWTQTGSPDSGNQGFEGTKIHNTKAGYFVYSGGHTSCRAYTLNPFAFVGTLDVTTTGGTDTFPHPMIFPNNRVQVMVSFDNTKYGAANFTWGNLRIYEAPRYK